MARTAVRAPFWGGRMLAIAVRIGLVLVLPAGLAWLLYALASDRWGSARVFGVSMVMALAAAVVLGGPAS